MTLLGTETAILRDDRLLLTRREDFHVWCLPGGNVDPGEPPADGARREVREELGLDVELTRLVGLYSRVTWGDRPALVVVFEARVVGGEWAPDPREVVEVGWFPLDALPSPLLWVEEMAIRDVASRLPETVWRHDPRRWPAGAGASREELYAARDASGLGRQEFYLRHLVPAAAGGRGTADGGRAESP